MKITFQVTDMHCPNCAMKIESLEDNLPGVKQISASYAKSRVVVEFDEGLLKVEEIIKAVKETGYTVLVETISSAG